MSDLPNDHPPQPPHRDDDLREWNEAFAENNQEIKDLMAEALRLLDDQNRRLDAADDTPNS